ncbi:MAG: hypothetical protein KGJ40_06280 [candidate division NC10 bacterium]|nr:hypothetical protein [candidate division NC10 bacterium]
MRKGRVWLSMVVCILSLLLAGVASAGQWAKTYGGTGDDTATAIQQTADGGYIVAGTTISFGAGGDAWVLKLDSSGNVTWQKTYGGTGSDGANAIQQTADGGYIVAGWTTSFGAGSYDAWVLKLDSSGNVTWQKTYGGSNLEIATTIQQTADGGYIVAGSNSSFSSGNEDAWVLKLDSSGNVTWQKTYGGTGIDFATAIQQTADGGYIVAGRTDLGASLNDAWVLKLDSSGTVTWQQSYGGAIYEWANAIQQTADGGYIVAGSTKSFGAGSYDVWVLKLDNSGTVTWQQTYGGTGDDRAYAIQQTADGGYIVAGHTSSFGAGGNDAWVLKLDSSGTVTWQQTYGGVYTDEATAIQQTTDGGYIVAGHTSSFGAGGNDAWVLKLDSSGNITGCAAQGTSNATVTTTSVTGATSTVLVSTTTATVSATTVTPQDSTALPTTVCSPATFTLTVTKAGTGSGTVTSSPAGISCGATCSGSFASGTAVTLTATPAADSTFAGWSGDCNSSGQVTMNANKSCTATFTRTTTTVTLTVTMRGSGPGTVTSAPAGISCTVPGTCVASYTSGTSVTLTASPGSGASFKSWGGACSGITTTCTVTLTANQSVTATFSQLFTDPTLTARNTLLKAVHVTELRSAINTLRAVNNLAALSWTDPTLTVGTVAKKVHLDELRTALGQAYQAAGQSAPSYTDPTLVARSTVIKASHISELRTAVRALE